MSDLIRQFWMQPLAMMFPRFTFLASPLLLAPPVLLALSLSACTQFDSSRWLGGEGGAAPTVRPSAEPQASRAPAPARVVKPAPELKALRPTARPAADKEIASLPSASALPPKLVGLSEDETADLLGRPVEETTAAPGKIWVYKASGCQLSVHLFPDMERGGFYALDYTADGARESCLGKVAGEARKKGGAVVEESAKPG